MTPDRAREVIRAQSQFPYWGNYQKFMTAEEIAEVRQLFDADRSGSITFGAVVQRIARRDYFEAPPNFDDKDVEIARERLRLWNERTGPRVGDWIAMRDGTLRRFSHNWGDGLQVTIGNGDCGSFYFARGCMSYSGGLDPIVPLADIIETSEIRNGAAWFFHHDSSGAGRGVYFTAPCRVYRQAER